VNPWRPLRGLPRGLWILFSTTLVNRAGTMVLPFLALYLTEERGFTTVQAGRLVALYGVGSIVAAPVAGWLCDRVPPRRVMEGSLLLSGLAVLLLPGARGVVAIAGAVGLWSVLAEFFRPASLSILHDLAPPDRGRIAVALQRLAINLGMSVGPAVGGFLALRSFRAVFVVDGLTSIAAFLVMVLAAGSSMQIAAHARTTEANGAAAASPWSDRRFLFFLLAILPAGCVFFQLQSTLALFLVHDVHLPASVYGLLFTVNTLLIVAIEVPLIAWISRHPIHWSTTAGAILMACGFGSLGLARGLASVVASTVVWTFGEMLLLPALVAQAGQLAPPARRGAYMGVYGLALNLTVVLGPWLGTSLLDYAGPAVLWGSCLLAGLASAAMFWRVRETAAAASTAVVG
jgi:MFS family permease